MLTLEREQAIALDYSVVNTSIQETFTAIDRFEWQAVDEILLMREQQLYLQAGYKNFEEYCQRELYPWGGYRRINQLLGAKTVIDTVGELGGHIKNERQARPLLRLVKEPEKLKQAVAIAGPGTAKRKCPGMLTFNGHGFEKLSQCHEQYPGIGGSSANSGKRTDTNCDRISSRTTGNAAPSS
ncbi:hypothetical protein [Nostoc sp.]|uniref:hypothetical protein n=1 Tax=Nostoc sp. TaxID=1180 RepID=UPI003FA5DD6A